VTPTQRSSAATLSAIQQQVAMVFGVALAAAMLNLSQYFRGGEILAPIDFRIAFAAIGAIGLVASFPFLSLPHDAAAEVSGHASEPKRVR
jgi:hypothetical protein